MRQRRGGFVPVVGTLVVAVLTLAGPPAAAQPPAGQPATPAEMVATYDALADGILALKKTEAGLVRSIIAATFAHARVQLGRARAAMAASDAAAARGPIEALAADVAQLATEGDSAVGAVRKRLLEGGHHHNAAGERQGLFDEGFVVVTRAAKQELLAASRAIGRTAHAPEAAALEAEWKKVEAVVHELMEPAK